MHSRRSLELHQIHDQRDLAECWVDTYRECRAAEDPSLGCADLKPEWDKKLATLTRWLLACFEYSPGIPCIYLRSRECMLLPANGEIRMVLADGAYRLNMTQCPMDPEDVPDRVFQGASAVTMDACWIDDGLEV